MTDETLFETANKNTNATPEGSVSMGDTPRVSQQWMHYQTAAQTARPFLNANQRTSIAAMIAYISSRSGQSEFRVERNLSDRFNVPNPKYLSADSFDEAIRFLADIISV
jgi:hypothetical protein